MPIPFVQDRSVDVSQDTQGEQAQASIPETYLGRSAQTLQDSFIGEAYSGTVGAIKQNDGSETLNPEDARNQYGNGGLTHFDSPVSRDFAQWKAGQDAQKLAINDTLERGGINSAKNTWLGFGLSTAVGFLDPISDAVAIGSDGITKFNPIARPLGDIAAKSAIAGRFASGAVKAAAFSGITEPIHYALDDNWSLNDAAQRLGSGALFLGLTEGIFGRTPLKFFSEEADHGSITPEQEATYNLLEDHLAPETKVALSQASVARAKSGESFDPLNALVGLDPRIIAHEAVTGELSFEERAKVLASMDDGTYITPSMNKEGDTLASYKENNIYEPTFEIDPFKESLSSEMTTQELKNRLIKVREQNVEANGEDASEDDVTQSTVEELDKRGVADAGVIDLNDKVTLPVKNNQNILANKQNEQDLIKQRVASIRDTISKEQTRVPTSIDVKKAPNNLAEEENRAIELNSSFEKKPIKEEGKELEKTPSQKIVSEEDAKEPGYNEAIRCVTGTA